MTRKYPTDFINCQEFIFSLNAGVHLSGNILDEYFSDVSYEFVKSDIEQANDYWIKSKAEDAYYYIYDFGYIIKFYQDSYTGDKLKISIINIRKCEAILTNIMSLARFMTKEDYNDVECGLEIDLTIDAVSISNILNLNIFDKSYGNVQFRVLNEDSGKLKIGIYSDAENLDDRICACILLISQEQNVRAKLVDNNELVFLKEIESNIEAKFFIDPLDKVIIENCLNNKRLPFGLTMDVDRLDFGTIFEEDGKIFVKSNLHGFYKNFEVNKYLLENIINSKKCIISYEEKINDSGDKQIFNISGAIWYEYNYGPKGIYVERIIPELELQCFDIAIKDKYLDLLQYLWIIDDPGNSMRPSLRLVLNMEL